jgi:hypothetical protein
MKTSSEQLIDMATEAMKAIDDATFTGQASVRAVKWKDGKTNEIQIEFENDKHSRQAFLMGYYSPEINRQTLDDALAAIKANDMDAFIKISGVF